MEIEFFYFASRFSIAKKFYDWEKNWNNCWPEISKSDVRNRRKCLSHHLMFNLTAKVLFIFATFFSRSLILPCHIQCFIDWDRFYLSLVTGKTYPALRFCEPYSCQSDARPTRDKAVVIETSIEKIIDLIFRIYKRDSLNKFCQLVLNLMRLNRVYDTLCDLLVF